MPTLRKEQSRILNELDEVTGLKRKPRKRQRGRTYGPDVEAGLLIVPVQNPRVQPRASFCSLNRSGYSGRYFIVLNRDSE